MSVELINATTIEKDSESIGLNIKPLKVEGASRNQLNALAQHALGEEGKLANKSVHPFLIGLQSDNKSGVEQLSASAVNYLAKNFPLNFDGLSFSMISHETMIGIGLVDPPDYAILVAMDFKNPMPATNTVRDPFFGTFNQFLETLK